MNDKSITLMAAIEARIQEIQARKAQEEEARRQEEERRQAEDHQFMIALLAYVHTTTGITLGADDLQCLHLRRLGQGRYRVEWRIPVPALNGTIDGWVRLSDHAYDVNDLAEGADPLSWQATHPGHAAIHTTDLLKALTFAYSGLT